MNNPSEKENQLNQLKKIRNEIQNLDPTQSYFLPAGRYGEDVLAYENIFSLFDSEIQWLDGPNFKTDGKSGVEIEGICQFNLKMGSPLCFRELVIRVNKQSGTDQKKSKKTVTFYADGEQVDPRNVLDELFAAHNDYFLGDDIKKYITQTLSEQAVSAFLQSIHWQTILKNHAKKLETFIKPLKFKLIDLQDEDDNLWMEAEFELVGERIHSHLQIGVPMDVFDFYTKTGNTLKLNTELFRRAGTSVESRGLYFQVINLAQEPYNEWSQFFLSEALGYFFLMEYLKTKEGRLKAAFDPDGYHSIINRANGLFY